MNIKRVAVVGLGVLLWAAQAMASQWDDQINQWKKESINLKAEQIPQLEEAAKNGDVRATYLLYLETNNARFEYSKRSSANQLGQLSQRIADAGNPIGMRMLCYLFTVGQGGVVKDELKGFQWCQKSAQAGLVNAMRVLGNTYLNGAVGGSKDTTEALKWFRKGAELNDGESIGNLGFMYDTGTGVAKDEAQAIDLYKKAADLGVTWAMRSLGHKYREGNDAVKDESEAVYWYRKGAELDDGESIGNLGYMYETGKGVKKDIDQAINLYKRVSDKNIAWVNANMGNIYRDGKGVSKDESEPVYWYRKGAELDDGESIGNLGYMYETGKGVIKDLDKAINLYEKAADKNIAWVNANLGSIYRDGKGVSKDEKKAINWYRKGADLNDSNSIASLGAMYRDGVGVTKDSTEAVKWFLKGADLKNAYSIAFLGAMYRDGAGVTKDVTKAMGWFRIGSDLNDAYSISSLGYMFRDGIGVPKNVTEAVKWFRKGEKLQDGVSIGQLGYMYLKGMGVPKDETEAVRLFRRGFDLKDAYSIRLLGVIYRDGTGVIEDATEAQKLFIKGAELNDAHSMVRLGHMYLYRKDIPQDFGLALNWFRKAAELGTDACANTAIGELYQNGHGVVLDEVEASKWFRKAADGGDAAGMVQLAENYKLGRGVSRNLNESARLYLKAFSAEGSAVFSDTSESGPQRARRFLDAMLAANEITDPEVLREVRALSKPAPKAVWVQAPQTTIEEEVTFKVNVVDGGGGIGDVSFKLNGVALNVAQGRNASVIEVANTNVRTFTFRLPPGKHDVEVIAYNAENLINWTSLKSTVTSTFKPIRKPQLHAVIVGINDYENDKLKLRFAANDATEVAKVLKASVEKLYDQVHVKLLNTRSSTGKAAILQALKEAASKAQTEDVFVFYVAGHGVNFEDKGYHMLTADVGVTTDKAIQERSISAKELQSAIYDVPSVKKVVLLDTCQSGGGLDATKLIRPRGMDDLDMVKDMNRKSGAIVLAAAESQQDAMEGYKGRGIFTFVLLEALQGKADTKGDGFVSTHQLLEYIPDRTWKLAQEAFNGKKQSPSTSGSNGFPFLKWK